MTDNFDTDPPATPLLTLRAAVIDDKAAMMSAMAPYRNRYFPRGLDTRRTLVAEVEGEVVGFVGWKKDEVLALYVADNWRGQKFVGPELLAAAEAAMGRTGVTKIRIMIDADATGAHRFYMKHDYVTHWDRSNEDIAWMTKEI